MCSQEILPGWVGPFMRFPVVGLYCIILPMRQFPSVSICRKMMDWSGVEARRYSAIMRPMTAEGRMAFRYVMRLLFPDGGGFIDAGMRSGDGRSGRP